MSLDELSKNLKHGFEEMYQAGLNYRYIEHFEKIQGDEHILACYQNPSFGMPKNLQIFFDEWTNRIKQLEQKICSQSKKHV